MTELQNICWSAELDLDQVQDSAMEALKTKKLFRYQFKETTSAVTNLEKEIVGYRNTLNFIEGRYLMNKDAQVAYDLYKLCLAEDVWCAGSSHAELT